MVWRIVCILHPLTSMSESDPKCLEAFTKDQSEELAQLQLLFDLRWKADMRAIKMWQAAGPDRDLIWPDHADLVVWMLEQLKPAKKPKG